MTSKNPSYNYKTRQSWPINLKAGNGDGMYGSDRERWRPRFRNDGEVIPNRVYVGGLGHYISENDLHDLFSKFGKVDHVGIITDGDRSKGYGFITFSSTEVVSKLLNQVETEPLEVRGRVLLLGPARQRRGHLWDNVDSGWKYSTGKSTVDAKQENFQESATSVAGVVTNVDSTSGESLNLDSNNALTKEMPTYEMNYNSSVTQPLAYMSDMSSNQYYYRNVAYNSQQPQSHQNVMQPYVDPSYMTMPLQQYSPYQYDMGSSIASIPYYPYQYNGPYSPQYSYNINPVVGPTANQEVSPSTGSFIYPIPYPANCYYGPGVQMPYYENPVYQASSYSSYVTGHYEGGMVQQTQNQSVVLDQSPVTPVPINDDNVPDGLADSGFHDTTRGNEESFINGKYEFGSTGKVLNKSSVEENELKDEKRMNAVSTVINFRNNGSGKFEEGNFTKLKSNDMKVDKSYVQLRNVGGYSTDRDPRMHPSPYKTFATFTGNPAPRCFPLGTRSVQGGGRNERGYGRGASVSRGTGDKVLLKKKIVKKDGQVDVTSQKQSATMKNGEEKVEVSLLNLDINK